MNSDRFYFRRFFKKSAAVAKAPVRKRLLETLEDRILYDAAPVVTVQTDTAVGLGETIGVTVSFDNAGTDTGFGPWVDVAIDRNGADGTALLPDGVTPGPVDGFVLATPPQYLGVGLNYTIITLDDTANGGLGVLHPYATDANGDAVYVSTSDPTSPFYNMLNGRYQSGDLLMVIEMPFGSFTPDQPAADITFSLELSEFADVGAVLPISAAAGFRYGMDALVNPDEDPAIIGNAFHVSPQVEATLATVGKQFSGPESETATGPNFLRTYRIYVDVAAGQSLSNLNLFDQLSDQLQFVGISGSSHAYTLITQPSTSLPGGDIQVEFNGTIVGTAGAQDAWIDVQFYVPRLDAANASVLNQATGAFQTIENQAYGYANWTPQDPRDATLRVGLNVALDGSGNPDLGTLGTVENTFVAKSLAVQKGVVISTDTGATGATPGDILTYTIDFQISDYYAFGSVVITDVFSDGQVLTGFTPTLQINGNTFTLSAAAMTNYTTSYNAATGQTTVTFDISAELIARGRADGNLLGGGIDPTAPTPGIANNLNAYNDGATTGRITFQTQILDQFAVAHTLAGQSGEASLNSRDALTNDVTIEGAVLDLAPGFASLGNYRDDASTQSVSIVEGEITKTIYAINGLLVTDPTFNAIYRNSAGAIIISPADTITYRLTYSVPSGDLEDFRFADYLPLPVFSAGEVATFNASGSGVPPAGSVHYGPGHTMNQIGGGGALGDPTITVNSANNSINFSFGDASDPTNTERLVDILFTVTVSANPFADGLYLTNQALAAERSTQQPSIESSSQAIIQVVLGQPDVSINKGVVASTQGGAASTTGGLTFAGTSGNGFTGTLTGSANAAAIGALDLVANPILPDAGDRVRFALVVQNNGGADAFDVTFKDKIAGSYENNYATSAAFASATNLRVYDGAGALLTNGGDYTLSWNNTTKEFSVQLVDGGTGNGGLNFGRNPVTNADVTDGSNSVVVLYDLTVATGAVAASTITTHATLTNYAGAEGGADHSALDRIDAASVRIAIPEVAKTLVTTSVVETGNSALQAVIGELVTYRITITVPEGTTLRTAITDAMDAGLAFVGITSVTSSSGVSFTNPISTGTNPTNVTVGSSGGGVGNILAFDFGAVTNTNTNNATAETIIVEYQAVVLNVTANQSGTQLNNTADLSWVWTDDRAAAVVAAATTANLSGFSTNNRGSFTGVATTIDGVALAVGQLILVKDQTNAAQNGIYLVTAVAGTATLVRADGYDQPAELRGNAYAPIANVAAGASNAGKQFALSANVNSVNGSAVTFEELVGLTTSLTDSSNVVTVVEPQLSISNSLSSNNTTWINDGTLQVSAGQTVYYQVVIENTGNVAAYDLSLYDRLPNILLEAGVSGTKIYSVIVSNLDGSGAVNITGNGDFVIVDDTTYLHDPLFVPLPALTSANSSLDLAVGKKITIVVESKVKDDAVAASTHPNGIQVRWTSLNDNVRSIENTDIDVDPSIPVGGIKTPIVLSIHNATAAVNAPTGYPAGATTIAIDNFTGTIAVGTAIYSGGTFLGTVASTVQTSGNTTSITFTTGLAVSLTNNEVLTVATAVERTGSQGAAGGLNNYAATDDLTSTILEIQPVAIVKDLIGSGVDNANNSATEAVIGEYVDYTISFDIPKGLIRGFTLTDVLPPGMAFVDFLSITVGTNITTNISGVTGGVPTATANSLTAGAGTNAARLDGNTTVSSNGSGFVVNFGDIYNSATAAVPGDYVAPQQITITYRVVVTNIIANQSGDTFTNVASVAYSSVNDTTGTSVNLNTNSAPPDTVTLIEPALQVVKTITPATGTRDAGDPVQYTIIISHTGASQTDAFDLSFNDPLSPYLSTGSFTVIHSTAGDISAQFEVAGGQLRTIAGADVDLRQGANITITVNTTITANAPAGVSLASTATVGWTSIDGTPSFLSSHTTDVTGADDTERTGAGGVGADSLVLNNYAATSTAMLAVATPAADLQWQNGSVSADDSSVATSAGGSLVIGEQAYFDILVTLPEGITQDLRVLLNLPAGMRYDSYTILTAAGSSSLIPNGFGGTVAQPPGVTINGGVTTFDFDNNVTTANTNTPTDNAFVIRVTATVLNTLTNQVAVELRPTVTLQFNDPDGTSNNGTPTPSRSVNDGNAGNNPVVTIVEPTLAITKSSTLPAGNPLDAGDTINYTITLTNSSGQTAYDVTLSDLLNANLTLATLGSVATTGGATAVLADLEIVETSTGSGIYILRTTSGANIDIPTGASVTITFSATVSNTIPTATTIPNVANVRWTSTDGTTHTEERGGGGVLDNAPTTINQALTTGVLNNYALSSAVVNNAVNNIVVTKAVTNTSVGGNDGVAAPGEIVTYTLTVTLPEGVVPGLRIRDALPAGMAYIAGSLSLGDLTGFGGSVTAPGVSPTSGTTYTNGQDIEFAFSSITVTADNNTTNNTFTFTFQAVVLDVVGNVGAPTPQTVLSNSASHNNGSGSTYGGTTANANVTVVEPRIANFNQSVTASSLDAGDAASYSITFSNTGTSTAYEVNVADALPASLALNLASISVTMTGGSAGVTNNSSGNNLNLSIATIPVGGSVTITYTGTLQSTVTPNQTISNTANLTYSSLPGNQTAAGGYNPNADVTTDHERTYAASSAASFNAAAATFAKSLFSTDKAFTTGSNVAIGEMVTYALKVTLPEGSTPDLTIIDRLPVGLKYAGASLVTIADFSEGLLTDDFSGTLPIPTITGGGTSGADLEFVFGSIAVNGDNATGNNSFVIFVTAVVENELGNQNAQVLAADATFDISGDGQAVFTTPAVNVTVVEPRVNVAKTVTSATTGIDAGDTVTYQITINNLAANGASADAFNVALTDVLPAGLSITAIGAPTLSGGATVDTMGDVGNTITGVFDIPLGGSVTFTVTALVADTVNPGQTLTSDTNVTFASLNDANTGERNGSDITNPESNTPPTDNAILNNYAVGVDVSVTVANNFSVTKSLLSTSESGSTGNNVLIGETLTYQLAVAVIEGTTQNLSLVDTLPAGLTYVPGSVTVTNANGVTINGLTASLAGQTLTIAATSVVNPGGSNGTTNNPVAPEMDVFFITYQVQVANVVGNTAGTTLINDVDASATGVPNDNNNQVTVTVTEPALTLTKASDDTDGSVTRGQLITYTLTLTNSGTATAYDLALTDVIPTGLTLVAGSLTVAGGTNTSSGANINVGFTSLAVGASVTVTYQVRVDLANTAGTVIENNARVSYSSLPGTVTGERSYAPNTANEVYNATTDPRQDTERITVGTASIGDRIWQDRNGDGVQDAGETGISGVRVYIDLDGDGIYDSSEEPSTVTDINGSYVISGLAAGTYTVRVDTSILPAAATQTFDLSGPLDHTASATLTAGQNRTDVDFGYQGGASVGNFVWDDTNGNGRQDASEPGVAGVALTLTFAGFDGIFGNADDQSFSTATDALGNYAFSGLFGGNYRLTTTSPAGMQFTTQDSPLATDVTDSDANITTGRVDFTLTNTQTNNNIDVGLYTPSSLGNLVYNDLDGDGVRDAGELGIAGVTVTATWLGLDGVDGGTGSNADVTYTATTDSTGAWSVTGLPPGVYRVTVGLTTGGFNTLTDSIDNGVLDPANGVLVTVPSGSTLTNIDFGLRGAGSVGNRVYHDVNADGDFDAGTDLGL
ncbi:MAG: isopeptide-forming domain-containing fimbrial protein, partial [Rariglobus sp.]